MLGMIWDDTLGGPQPDNGLSRLRNTSNLSVARAPGEGSEVNGEKGKQPKFYIQRSLSIDSSASPPSSPIVVSSLSPSCTPRGQDNIWRSVFHPCNNINTKSFGSENFDKTEPNSPTVYDWFYSGETNSKGR